MYATAYDCLFGDQTTLPDRVDDFIHKLLQHIPLLRRVKDVNDFLEKLGEGWPEAEEVLKEWIPICFCF